MWKELLTIDKYILSIANPEMLTRSRMTGRPCPAEGRQRSSLVGQEARAQRPLRTDYCTSNELINNKSSGVSVPLAWRSRRPPISTL